MCNFQFRFSQGDDDEEDSEKFLTSFWKDKGAPVKPQTIGSGLPDRGGSFQIPRGSAAGKANHVSFS